MLRILGMRGKISLGPWFRPAFAALVAMRRLRGTALDPFGRTEVRRAERALLAEYRDAIARLAETLTAGNHARAVQIAGLPDMIRGYEDVKLGNVRAYRARLAELLAARTEDHLTDTADDARHDAQRPRSRFAEALRPLASRPYRLMWLGSTTSSLGDAVVQIALVFAVLHIGGTATDIGLIAALQTVARVVFLLAGGVWADRLRRQYVMLAADLLRGGVEAVLAVLLLTGRAHVGEIAVGAVLYGIGASFFGPASTGLTPETVPAEQLQQANSLLDLPQSFFSVGGPAIGGVLIAVFGTGWLFAFDAGSFAVSVLCLAQLRVPPRSLPAAGSFLADLAEGWHELAIRPWYWINLIAHACWNFAVPALLVLGPVIAARSLGGATAWGLISAAWGVGAVGAGLFVLRVKPRRPLVVGNLLLTLGALPLLTLAFSRSVPLICAANALSGFGLVALNGLWSPTMQVLIPDQVRSRVDSYDWLVSLVIMPVGFAVAGPLASSAGYTSTLVAAAIVIAVPCALVVLVPGVRGVHRNAAGDIVGPATSTATASPGPGPAPGSGPAPASGSGSPSSDLSATPLTGS